jgi:hypothetical protein
MRKIEQILIILLYVVIIVGCDKIDPPYLENTNSTDTTFQRKVLLEEYTGFRCGNCPEATEVAHSLKEKYKSSLILLSIHAGGYAKPTSTYTYDFRTSIGNELDAFFGMSAAGNPDGMVNRFGYPTGSHILREGEWEGVILQALKTKPVCTISLESSYSETTSTINIKVTVKYLDEGTPNHHLCVYIAEDSIVQYQRDDRLPDPHIFNYVHNNVLRAGITSTWGEQLSPTAIPLNTVFTKEYSYQIPQDKDWRVKKLKIVAFVHDKDNSFEILQAEEQYLFRQ